jgi:hypothetical protein
LDQALWDSAQARLVANAAIRRSGTSSKEPSLLAGLLFDGGGNRMTPSHAVKSGKRYRYYVSNYLIAGAEKGSTNAGTGLRLSAQEVERHVTTAITRFLGDPVRLVAALREDATPEAASAAIERARIVADTLAMGAACYETLRSLIDRVTVTDIAIQIGLSTVGLESHLNIGSGGLRSSETIRLEIAAEIRRLGKEKRLIVSAHAPKTKPDSVLIKAVIRAHRWFNMLKDGTVESISELARIEDVQRTYTSRIIPLAFLAPDITEAILEGRQPIDLSLDRLLEAMPLPLAWTAQRTMLGFRAR